MEHSKDLPEYAARALSPEEIDTMAVPMTGLLDSHGWRVYAEVLKRFRIQARESFETAGNMESVQFTKGLITGLKLAETAPTTVIEEAKKHAERDRLQSQGRQRLRNEILRPGGDDSF